MSLVILYGSREAAFAPVDLGDAAVRLGAFQVTMSASMGDVGSSTIAIDDPTGDAGHAGDQIEGYHTIEISEDACAVGNQLILSSFTGDRTYASADSLITDDAVRINIDLQDCNRVTQFQLLRGSADALRPAETVGARLTWLIASAFSEFVDSGLVVYPATLMDSVDYNGQTDASVLDDCAQTVGYNWFIYKASETATDYSLFFDDPNTSTAYSSDLRISNVLADIDSTVNGGVGATQTWGPLAEPTLKRSPQNLASGVLMPWSGGTYFGFRGATRDIYGDVSITAADSNVKTFTTAAARVDRLLWQASTEEDVINVSLQLPAANVNDVREGQRMQAKFRQLPGYKSAYSWFRVMYRTVSQQALTDEFYTVDLTLSPQEEPQPVGTIVQSAFAYGYADGIQPLALTNPITPGNLLVYTGDRWKGNGNNPIPPNVSPGSGDTIGGTGAWDLVGSIVTTAASGDRGHVGMWQKVATDSQQSGPVFSPFTWGAIYELSTVTATGITVASASNQSASGVLDAGSLGSPAAGDIAIMVAAQYSSDVGPMSFSPTPWTTDAATIAVYFGTPRPYWQGHFVCDGSALEAEVSSTVNAVWCAIGAVFHA